MSLEWGKLGLRVNALAPGLIDGGMSEPIYSDPHFRKLRTEKVPVGRLGTEEDIAQAVLFLGSEKASYITGHELVVDGGIINSIIANLPRPSSVDSVGLDGSDFEIAIKVAPHHIEWERCYGQLSMLIRVPYIQTFGILITFILFTGTQAARALNLGLRFLRLPKLLRVSGLDAW